MICNTTFCINNDIANTFLQRLLNWVSIWKMSNQILPSLEIVNDIKANKIFWFFFFPSLFYLIKIQKSKMDDLKEWRNV